MTRLTEKQKKFADEYLLDLNATQAAIRAGYSARNADKIGSELLGKTRVAEYIQKRQKDREKRTEITQDRVLEELAHIAFDDMKNYLSFKTIKTQVGVEDGKSVIGYDTVVDFKDSDSIDTRNISEISKGRDGQFKFKLYSKDNALVQLGKHLGVFDKSDATDSLEKLALLRSIFDGVKDGD